MLPRLPLPLFILICFSSAIPFSREATALFSGHLSGAVIPKTILPLEIDSSLPDSTSLLSLLRGLENASRESYDALILDFESDQRELLQSLQNLRVRQQDLRYRMRSAEERGDLLETLERRIHEAVELELKPLEARLQDLPENTEERWALREELPAIHRKIQNLVRDKIALLREDSAGGLRKKLVEEEKILSTENHFTRQKLRGLNRQLAELRSARQTP